MLFLINDQVLIMNYEIACIFTNRKNELMEYRKTNGIIVGEEYIKFIIQKHNMKLHLLENFNYDIIRP